jgi:membrane protease YdiL (CAAX protease family)
VDDHEQEDGVAQRQSTRRDLATFLALTYGLTWLFWVPTAVFGRNVTGSFWLVPFMLGGFGPSAAGILMVYRGKDRAGRRAFWNRVVDVRRISLGWYGLILLVFPASFVVVFLVDAWLGHPLPELETWSRIAANPLMLVGMSIGGIITGPLSEELGWRGFALDRLQAGWTPFVSSLTLALFWWGWHLPLFFISGTTHAEWGIGTPSFWLFLAATGPLSILLTWVYNQNSRSILAAVLLHFTYNLTLNLVHPMSVRVHALHVVSLGVAAMGLMLTQKPLGRGRQLEEART